MTDPRASGVAHRAAVVALLAGRRLLPGLVYAAALVAGTACLLAQPPARAEQWRVWASTSVDNLEHDPLGCLVVSALFAGGDLPGWILLAVVGVGGLGWIAGTGRALAVCAGGHVVGTLLSEGLVAVRVATGGLPASSRHLMDLGPSYVVVAGLVACAVYGTPVVRIGGAVGFAFLAPDLFAGLSHGDVSAVGHTTAIVTAVVMGWWVVRRPGVGEPPASAAP